MADAFRVAPRGFGPLAPSSQPIGGPVGVGLGVGVPVEAEKSANKAASGKSRRPLQPIDVNRLQAPSGQAKALGKRPLGALAKFEKQASSTSRGIADPVAKRRNSEVKRGNLEVFSSPELEREEAGASDPGRENLAWMDMLLALLERKYGRHEVASVEVSDLLDAKMFEPKAKKQRTEEPQEDSKNGTDSCQIRRQEGGEALKRGRPAHENEREREDRRRQLLLRYAQQIQDSSVNSSTTCGCKTGCLKMYCVCFSSRGFCHSSCSCDDCKNSRANKDDRLLAIQSYLANDPRAFSYASHHQTTTATGFLHLLPQKSNAVVQRGCRCKKSKCLKKYCECFQNGIACTAHCRCSDCSNHTEAASKSSNDRKQAVVTAASPTKQPFHQVQVTVTKQPKRNSVRKSIRLSL